MKIKIEIEVCLKDSRLCEGCLLHKDFECIKYKKTLTKHMVDQPYCIPKRCDECIEEYGIK